MHFFSRISLLHKWRSELVVRPLITHKKCSKSNLLEYIINLTKFPLKWRIFEVPVIFGSRDMAFQRWSSETEKAQKDANFDVDNNICNIWDNWRQTTTWASIKVEFILYSSIFIVDKSIGTPWRDKRKSNYDPPPIISRFVWLKLVILIVVSKSGIRACSH